MSIPRVSIVIARLLSFDGPRLCAGGGRAVHPIRWRQEYGGLKLDQVKRLKELELENARLRKAVSDLTLDKLILKEAARGNY
jgi:hypothetical protein